VIAVGGSRRERGRAPSSCTVGRRQHRHWHGESGHVFPVAIPTTPPDPSVSMSIPVYGAFPYECNYVCMYVCMYISSPCFAALRILSPFARGPGFCIPPLQRLQLLGSFVFAWQAALMAAEQPPGIGIPWQCQCRPVRMAPVTVRALVGSVRIMAAMENGKRSGHPQAGKARLCTPRSVPTE